MKVVVTVTIERLIVVEAIAEAIDHVLKDFMTEDVVKVEATRVEIPEVV